MKVILESPINKYYVQTLGMIFFPGEHFGKDEEQDDNPEGPSLYVKSAQEENGIRAYAKVTLGEKTNDAEYFAEFLDTRTEERTLKLAVGGAVLAAAGGLMGYRPAWGMLIGVRPSKVASEMLDKGMSKTRVKRHLNSDYLVIPKKAALATDIAVAEKRIVGASSHKDCSVYISIPFCPSRCTYCSFVSYTSKRLLDLIPQYLERLKLDIRTASYEEILKQWSEEKTKYGSQDGEYKLYRNGTLYNVFKEYFGEDFKVDYEETVD